MAPHDDELTGAPLGDPVAYLAGLEGLALLRAFTGEHPPDFIAERVAELTRLLAEADAYRAGMAPPRRLSVEEGYDAWSLTYDDEDNGLLDLDSSIVRPWLAGLAAGSLVVDAACGTGRHCRWLADAGHRVIGVDGSEGMLAAARRLVPEADLRRGGLDRLPVDDAVADAVLCTLALTHLPAVAAAYAEFARVLRPGGVLVVSDVLPLYPGCRLSPMVARLADGSYGWFPGYRHTLAEHVTAALACGLAVTGFEERRFGPMVPPGRAPEDPRAVPYADPWRLMTLLPDAANAAYAGQSFANFIQFRRDPAR